jgi:DNA segregation ATPase FtsK/SpoIIIE-like protein
MSDKKLDKIQETLEVILWEIRKLNENQKKEIDTRSTDELFKESVKIVTKAKVASPSLLQRRLKIGYARAARLLDMLEDNGIIESGDGASPRKVLKK